MKEIQNILAFFKIFNRILIKKEIEAYLSQNITDKDLNNFSKIDNFYGFGKINQELIEKNKNQREISTKYLKKSFKYLSILRFFPYVRGIAVCNTTSFLAADEKSDIDLFIITEKNHIWTARIFITIYLQLLGVRRHGNKIASRFCLSFFADTDNLDLSKIKFVFDPFLAFWSASLVPIFGEQILQKFTNINQKWLQKEVGIKVNYLNQKITKNGGNFLLEFIFNSWFEKLMRRIFLTRAKNKAAKLKNKQGTIITNGMLKFHDNDRRGEFAEKYHALIKAV